MPGGIEGGTAEQEARQRRRRDRQTQPAPDTSSEYYGEPGVVNRTVTSLALVERASGGKLPAPLSYALSTVDLNDRQLRKAARLAARQLDLPASFLWGENQIAKMEDPLYGGQMRMSTLNRIMEGFEPVLLQGMLPSMLAPQTIEARPGSVRGPAATEAKPRAKAVVAAVKATARVADAYDMTARDGLALAINLAREKVDPKLAALNMSALQRYERAFTRDEVFGVAIAATKAKVEFGSVDEIVAFLTPRAVEASAFASEKVDDLKLFFGEDWEQALPADQIAARKAAAAEASGNIDLATYARQGRSYLAEAGAIEDDLRADAEAWGNSFVGKNLNRGLDLWNRAYTNIERGIITISTPIIGAGAEAGIPGFESTGWSDAFKFRDERFRDFAEGKHLGRQFVEDTAAPDWMGAPIDFALGWYLDPFSIGGKALTAARAGRVAPGVLDKTTLLRAGAQKVPGLRGVVSPTRRLGSAESYLKAVNTEAFAASGRFSHGESLFKSLMRSEDDYTRQVSTRYVTNFEARTAYDLPFMTALGRKLRSGMDEGTLTRAQARHEFGIGIMAQRGLQVQSDSIAAEVMRVRSRADETVFASFAREAPDVQQRLFDPTDSHILTPDANYADIAEDVISSSTNPISTRLEVPTKLQPVPGLGISRLAGRSLKESDLKLARSIARPFETPAGNFLKIHQDPPAQFEKVMRDWGPDVFNASQIRAAKAEIADLVQKGGFERQVISRLDELNEVAFKTYATGKGIPTEMVDNLLAEANSQQLAVNSRRSFGQLDERTALAEPVLETQLVNEYFFVNPHDAKQLVNRYTSTIFNMRNAYHTIPGASKTIDRARETARVAALAEGKDAKATNLAMLSAAKKAAEKEFSKMSKPQIYDMFDKAGAGARWVASTWKFSVVPRPGYIGRVILGDENLRFLATAGSMFERAAATHLDDATSALIRGFVVAPGIAAVPKRAAAAAGRGVDTTAGKVLDALYPNQIDQIRAPDGTITTLETQRPGRWDYEPFANTTWRETEIADDVVREAKAFEQLARSEHFGKLYPSDPQYYGYLAHNLTNQLGYSVPGTVALRSVGKGETIAQTSQALHSWGLANYRMLRGRIGVDDVDQWADDLAKLTHAYTMGQPQIALAAAARSDNIEEMLKLLPSEVTRPPIHGPLLQNLTGGGSGLSLRKYVDYWYDVFVRQPENILNRQPYYAVWKARGQRAYAQVSPGASREAIDAGARDFALAQVKRIMFDFTENTRLGESIGAVVPFLQPFLEQYSVWGHILAHRNPALIGYAHQLGRLGVESGFLRNDPTTGELMVPTSWWMEQSLLYDWITDTKGTATFTPLSSLNLFFSTTMKTPTRGPLGAVFGGAEVPLPGLSPWAGEALRELFKNSKNPQVASYLFAWGPNTPILPGSWSKILQAYEPELYGPGLLEAYEKRLATEYQDSGLTQQWIDELNEEGKDPREVAKIVKERITGAARRMLALNGFLQMFQLGATKVDLSVQEKEREFIQMMESEGGDYLKASERFLEKYPNNSLVPTSTTTPAAVMRDLEGNIIYDTDGKPVTIGYRLPASELAQRLINEDPEMRKTFVQFPELFGGLLLSLDPKLANDYDPAIGAQIIRDGLIRQKDLGRFLADGEGSGPAGFWEAVDDIEDAFDKATHGKDPDSLAYAEAERLKQQSYLHVWSQYPFYAPTRLEPVVENDQVVGAAFKWQGSDATSPRAVAKLRAFGQIEGLQDFGIAKAINLYFDGDDEVGITGRDELMAEMGRRGIGDITSVSAEDAGITERYETLKTAVEEAFPEGAYVIMQIIDDDLQRVGNTADKTLRTWKQAGDARYSAFADYDEQFQTLYNRKVDGQRDWDSLRDLVNSTMTTAQGRKIVQLQFERKPYYQQEDYRQNLMTLPVVFYSRFDFSLAGIDLKNQEAKAFEKVQDFQAAERARQAAANAEQRVYSIDYDRINALASQALKAQPGLAPAFEAVNTWAWGLRNRDLDAQPGKLGKAWEAVFKAVDYSQKDTARYDLHGYTRFVPDEDLAYWRSHQAWLRDVVNRYKKEIPAFRRQWDEMDDNYFTGSLYDVLMPETFFVLGQTNQ